MVVPQKLARVRWSRDPALKEGIRLTGANTPGTQMTAPWSCTRTSEEVTLSGGICERTY